MDTQAIKVGDVVTDGIRRTRYQVVKLLDVFGIPAADLQEVRKDGVLRIRNGDHVKIHNLPVSCLRKVEPELPYMQVVRADGYVKVVRSKDGATICAAVELTDKRIVDLDFMAPEYQKCNRTRQAACKALQAAGYR